MMTLPRLFLAAMIVVTALLAVPAFAAEAYKEGYGGPDHGPYYKDGGPHYGGPDHGPHYRGDAPPYYDGPHCPVCKEERVCLQQVSDAFLCMEYGGCRGCGDDRLYRTPLTCCPGSGQYVETAAGQSRSGFKNPYGKLEYCDWKYSPFQLSIFSEGQPWTAQIGTATGKCHFNSTCGGPLCSGTTITIEADVFAAAVFDRVGGFESPSSQCYYNDRRTAKANATEQPSADNKDMPAPGRTPGAGRNSFYVNTYSWYEAANNVRGQLNYYINCLSGESECESKKRALPGKKANPGTGKKVEVATAGEEAKTEYHEDGPEMVNPPSYGYYPSYGSYGDDEEHGPITQVWIGGATIVQGIITSVSGAKGGDKLEGGKVTYVPFLEYTNGGDPYTSTSDPTLDDVLAEFNGIPYVKPGKLFLKFDRDVSDDGAPKYAN